MNTITNIKSLLILSLVLLLGSNQNIAQNVGIGAESFTPHESAMLEVKSPENNPKGFLLPRMTEEQRDAIIQPADGLIIFNTSIGCPDFWFDGAWHQMCSSSESIIGTITSLDCDGAINNGTIALGFAANNVFFTVSYTGGNGGNHNGQTVASTGVTGLTATLPAGNFATGYGDLIYTITGTASNSGTASFELNISDQTCTITYTILPTFNGFNCGNGSVTFTYSGEVVTYTTVVANNGRCWLDRNLGASRVATTSNDHLAYGDLIQWGRLPDGHENRYSFTTTALANSDIPNNGGLYIVSPDGTTNDWRNASISTSPRWSATPIVNNPCPIGWRVPTNQEMIDERTTWASQNASGAFMSPLKLTVAGYRSYDVYATIWGEGSYGVYLTRNLQSAGSVNIMALYFDSTGAHHYGYRRGGGGSVRCIKD